jgi:hypothetical protein
VETIFAQTETLGNPGHLEMPERLVMLAIQETLGNAHLPCVIIFLGELEATQVLRGRQATEGQEGMEELKVNLTFKASQVRVAQAGMVGAMEGEVLYQPHRETVVTPDSQEFHHHL